MIVCRRMDIKTDFEQAICLTNFCMIWTHFVSPDSIAGKQNVAVGVSRRETCVP